MTFKKSHPITLPLGDSLQLDRLCDLGGRFNMKLIPLSQQGQNHKGKYFAMVDDEDFDYLMQFRWHGNENGNNIYALRYVSRKEHRSMHREIMQLKKGDRKIVDHKDMNGLNNQKSNLRICTTSQNSANIKSKLNSSSKYLGVKWHKKNRIWIASIKGKHIKCFKTEIEAALAYNESAIKNHGEFARLNIIENENK